MKSESEQLKATQEALEKLIFAIDTLIIMGPLTMEQKAALIPFADYGRRFIPKRRKRAKATSTRH